MPVRCMMDVQRWPVSLANQPHGKRGSVKRFCNHVRVHLHESLIVFRRKERAFEILLLDYI